MTGMARKILIVIGVCIFSLAGSLPVQAGEQATPEEVHEMVVNVPGQPYQVSAGIYNDDMTIDALNEILR